MSRKIYDYNKCYEIAQQCSSSTEMKNLNGSAYNAARKNNWIKDYAWFVRKQHTPYTYEEVYEIALNYTCSSDFQKGNGSAYGKARENGWIKDYTWFTVKQHAPYTYEECFEIAKKYKSRVEFARGAVAPYNAALNHGWLDDYTWFESPQKPYNYWTKERVKEESKKFKTRGEFHDQSGTAYGKARVNGWLDEFTWLKDDRIDFSNDKIDCVYAYEFENYHSVYVGRTLMRRAQERDYEHMFTDSDAVVLFAREHDVPIPPMKVLETGLTLKEGTEREGYYLEYYRSNGWNTLNRAKTGGIGLLFRNKWSKRTCREEAKKYRTRAEFAKKSPGAYEVARSNQWLDSYPWFEEKRKITGYWEDYKNCYDAALQCQTKSEFANKFSAAYLSARKKGWIKDYGWFLTEQEARSKARTKWRIEDCIEEAKKYKSKKEFSTNALGAYKAALRYKIMDSFDWFEPTSTVQSRAIKAAVKRKWTYDVCKELARQSKGRQDFRKKSSGAYNAAWENGWLDDFFPKKD